MADKLSEEAKGSNITKGQFLAWMRRAAGAKRAAEEASSAYRLILKNAKKDGINQKQLVAALAARSQDPDVLAIERRDFDMYMGFMGMPIGGQAGLFPEPKPDDSTTPAEDHDQQVWDAEEAGYKAGRQAAKRDTNPHDPGTELNQTWDGQWIRGQAFIASQMGPGVENVAAPKRGRGRPRKGAAGGGAAEVGAAVPEADDVDTVH